MSDYLYCAQCMAEADSNVALSRYADTIYRGFAVCALHFQDLRDKEAATRSSQAAGTTTRAPG